MLVLSGANYSLKKSKWSTLTLYWKEWMNVVAWLKKVLKMKPSGIPL